MSSANDTANSALNNEEEANDVVWVLTSAFLIFTMQSGYGILESGFVSRKNEVNIMVKNATTVLVGGLIFWVFGFGLSFDYMTNPYFSFGDLFKTADDRVMGVVYSRLVFQLAYCTTSTTLISGAMAERCKFVSYIIFIVFATVIYCVPAAWLWNPGGWLNKMGAVDIGGSGVVHLVGASTGLMGSIVLGPRLGRYDFGFSEIPLGNPTNALLGMFMLWWGWLGFNAGSTGGVVHNKWKYSARASVTTILASMSGGLVGMGLSFVLKRRMHDVSWLVNSVMGSLVAISGGAPIVRPWQALVIGAIASALVLLCIPLMRLLKIDDPTENFVTHGVCGIWGLIAIGLFPEADNLINYTKGKAGLFVSGDWTLLKNQIITAVCLMSWCCSTSLIALLLIKLTIGLRMPPEEEILGPDLVDHEIEHDYNADLMKTFRVFYQRSVQEKVAQSSTRKRNRPAEKY